MYLRSYSSVVEQWIENPRVSGSIPLLDNHNMNKQQINFLIKLKNFSIAKKELVCFKFYDKVYQLVKFLYQEGVIQSFFVSNNTIFALIRFYNDNNQLSGLKIVSKSSYKKSLKSKHLYFLKDTKQIYGLSTDKGLSNLMNCKKNSLGGKLLFID